MLRAAARRLAGGAASLRRALQTSAPSCEGEAAPAGVKEFAEQWARVAPSTLGLPEFPSSFLADESAGESAVDGERFNVNLYTPHGVVKQAKVRHNTFSDLAHHRRQPAARSAVSRRCVV